MSKIDELLKKVASDLDIENSKIKATVSKSKLLTVAFHNRNSFSLLIIYKLHII